MDKSSGPITCILSLKFKESKMRSSYPQLLEAKHFYSDLRNNPFIRDSFCMHSQYMVVPFSTAGEKSM